LLDLKISVVSVKKQHNYKICLYFSVHC